MKYRRTLAFLPLALLLTAATAFASIPPANIVTQSPSIVGVSCSGALGAGAAELSRDLTKDLTYDAQQWASVIIGGAAAALTGGNSAEVMTGAATALDGERYNRQLHQDEESLGSGLAA